MDLQSNSFRINSITLPLGNQSRFLLALVISIPIVTDDAKILKVINDVANFL